MEEAWLDGDWYGVWEGDELTDREEEDEDDEVVEDGELLLCLLGLVIFIHGWLRMFSMVGLSSGWGESIQRMRD